MSEFELNLLWQRSREAILQKARRGELQLLLPVGFCWNASGKIEKDPDQRVQQAIQLVFSKVVELGSVRQTLLWFRQQNVYIPVLPRDPSEPPIVWKLPVYRNVCAILTNPIYNPIYAGAYAFGRREVRIKIVDGRARKSKGHLKPRPAWTVLIPNHHTGYVNWEQYERNQAMLAANTHMKSHGNARAAAARCSPVFFAVGGVNECFTSLTPGRNISRLAMTAMMRICITASPAAFPLAACGLTKPWRTRCSVQSRGMPWKRRSWRQSRWSNKGGNCESRLNWSWSRLATKRDWPRDATKRSPPSSDWWPRNWSLGGTLPCKKTRDLEYRFTDFDRGINQAPVPSKELLLSLAQDLPAIWNSPSTDMRLKQRIVHILIEEIVADVDESAREIVLLIHWAGGRHSELRVKKRASVLS